MNTSTYTTTTPNRSNAYKKRLIKYLFQCILSEGSKILIFAIIFIQLQLFKEFLIALVTLMLLRTNGGGLHCKRYISCFLLSFSMILGNLILALNVSLPALFIRIILIVCILLGYRFVPVVSSNRLTPSKHLIAKCKRNTVVIISGYLLLAFVVPNSQFVTIGFWTITMHICQLLLATLLERRRT